MCRSFCRAVGIPEFSNDEGLSVYPNPTEGIMTLSMQKGLGEVSIFNTLGELVFQADIQSPTADIDLSSLPSGIYFLKVCSDTETLTRKIVLNK